MEYLFVTLIVFASLLIGRLIAKYTQEEITSGKKYFTFLEQSLLILLLFLFLGVFIYLLLPFSFPSFFFWIETGVASLGLLLGILLSFLGRRIVFFRNPFLYLGIGLAFSAFSLAFFLVMSSLVFMYGLVYSRNAIRMEEFFLLFFLLMIPAVFVYLVDFSHNAPFFFTFSFGGLLVFFLQTFLGKRQKRK